MRRAEKHSHLTNKHWSDLWPCDALIPPEIGGQTPPIRLFRVTRKTSQNVSLRRGGRIKNLTGTDEPWCMRIICFVMGMKKESDFISRLIYFSIKQKIARKSILTNGQVARKRLQWIMNHMMLWVHYREGGKVFLRRMYIQRRPCQQKWEKELHALLPPLHHCFTAPRRC